MGYHESVIGVSGSYFKFVKKKKGQNFQIFSKIKWIYSKKNTLPGKKNSIVVFNKICQKKILVSILDLLLLLITYLLYSAHTALIEGKLVNTP
jgi:hypothetical protein